MNALLIGTSLVLAAAVPAPDAACDRLAAATQAFSDAGQRGDGPAMAALLDRNVVFFNEGGDRANWSDMAAARPAPTPAPKVTMTVTDWTCRRFGDTAVTGFIDVRSVGGPDGPQTSRFRSVETWRREAAGWTMIGSQTLALPDDPVTVVLSPALLDEYVGTYEASDGRRFSFTREGDHLAASLGGGPATVQRAEVRDVFFTPGRSRFRKVFTRDRDGRVDGFLYRSEGHDLRFRRLPQVAG